MAMKGCTQFRQRFNRAVWKCIQILLHNDIYRTQASSKMNFFLTPRDGETVPFINSFIHSSPSLKKVSLELVLTHTCTLK